MTSRPRRFHFDAFWFDPGTGELGGPHGTERLQPKPAALLGLLLARAGQLVTREEIQRELWPGTQVEFDQGLNTCVRLIRTALREEAGDGGRIETLPRRGYRWRGPVREVAPPAGRRGVGAVALGLGLALAVAVAGVLWWNAERGARPAPGREPGPPASRIAVLPLVDSAEDERSTRVNDRLTESLVVHLTAAGLSVLGPATTAVYRGADTPHTEIGRALGVDLVVSGGYRAADGRLFVQAVRTSDGEHVFARRIDSAAEPQDDAALEIARGIVEIAARPHD